MAALQVGASTDVMGPAPGVERSRLRRLAAWVTLLVGIVVALLYLNGAAYSAWAASGPPSEVPQAWLHRAFTHLCFAVAALLVGSAAFRTIRGLPHVDRPSLWLALVAALALVSLRVRLFILVDDCLNLGGRWNQASFSCEKQQENSAWSPTPHAREGER